MAKRRSRSVPGVKGADTRRHPFALLLVDVINELEFDGASRLLAPALRMARRIASLKARAVRAGVPCVYVNDNFGQWRSDFRRLVERCLTEDVRGQEIA